MRRQSCEGSWKRMRFWSRSCKDGGGAYRRRGCGGRTAVHLYVAITHTRNHHCAHQLVLLLHFHHLHPHLHHLQHHLQHHLLRHLPHNSLTMPTATTTTTITATTTTTNSSSPAFLCPSSLPLTPLSPHYPLSNPFKCRRPPHPRCNTTPPLHCPTRPATTSCAPSPSRTPTTPPLLGGDTSVDPSSLFPQLQLLSSTPALYHIPSFLTPTQCDALITAQRSKTAESSLYLNFRVNQQLSASATSSEARALIASTDGVERLSSSMKSGFRAHVDPTHPALRPVLNAVQRLFGWRERRFVFEEGAWIRPNRRQVVVRDQTTVWYRTGEGVPPHVDGKDVTVLICLQEAEQGGATVFPDDGLSVALKRGECLVYRSKKKLLHYAEAVEKGEKWVLQLLIDCRIRADEIEM